MLSLLGAAGIRRPEELSRRTVSELFGTLRRVRHREVPLSPQTIRGYWQVGKGFASFLIAEGCILVRIPSMSSESQGSPGR